jgi:hypothetical protein
MVRKAPMPVQGPRPLSGTVSNPEHIMTVRFHGHNVHTPAEYRARALQVMHDTFVAMGRPDRPRIVKRGQLPAYVSGGAWVVKCGCGNSPRVEPAWALAVCFECGAEYEAVMPDDWEEGEKALLARDLKHRHWFPVAGMRPDHKGENARDLERENRDPKARIMLLPESSDEDAE